MTTGHADQDRLALAEVTCRLAHVDAEVTALTECRAFPEMPDARRVVRLGELEAKRSGLQRRRQELTEQVLDPEQVRALEGTLPAERRHANLDEYRMRRRERFRALDAKVAYLDTVVVDKAAPKDVRRSSRDARASARKEIDVLNAEPTDADLRPDDMCADGVHLASSHGFAWTAAQPAWPCPAWPGQQRVLEKVTQTIDDITSRTPDHELTRWQLTLYCGHDVQRTAHRSHPTYGAAASGLVRACEICGTDPAFVVAEKSLGPAAPAPPPPPPVNRPAARKALERRATKLEAELAAIRAQLQEDR